MTDPGRVRLVVLFGGRSAEHEVSCVSAYHVLKALDPARYVVDPIGITRDGEWVRADGTATSGTEALEATGTPVDPYATVRPNTADDLPVVVLPLLHGPFGEDGTVQGLLEVAGVPFVGSGVLGSAMCMDKLVAKDRLAHHGIPQPRWLAARASHLDDLTERVAAAGLPYPLFVKPANLGSSIGVAKVTTPADLLGAAQAAAAYDEWIVVEEGISGLEVEISVLGNESPRTSVPGQIVPGNEFYDYEDKYLDGATQFHIPADLPEPVVEEMRRLAVQAFGVLRCDGLARVDFFYEPHGRGLLVNEVNTIPGFTPISMYPKLWAASGLPYGDLVDELVRLALERHDRRSRFSIKR